jgi:hypothetical protein
MPGNALVFAESGETIEMRPDIFIHSRQIFPEIPEYSHPATGAPQLPRYAFDKLKR